MESGGLDQDAAAAGRQLTNHYEAADILGVARDTLAHVLNGLAAVSPDMAIRLEKAGWSSADFWLSRQTAYDLAQARKRED